MSTPPPTSTDPCMLRFRIECSSSINAQQMYPTMTNNVNQSILNVAGSNVPSAIQSQVLMNFPGYYNAGVQSSY